MPRINRFDTTFQVGNQLWLARFLHTHNSLEGVEHRTPDGKFIKGPAQMGRLLHKHGFKFANGGDLVHIGGSKGKQCLVILRHEEKWLHAKPPELRAHVLAHSTETKAKL